MSRLAGIALVLALIGGQAWAAADPAAMLVRVSSAARNANYEGVIVYQTHGGLETLRVVHGLRDGVELERVQALNGAPREVLKQNGKVICLLPKSRRLTLERPTPKGLFPELTSERVAQLASVYRFQHIGAARVAGRNCNGLAIMPRDRFRYGYRIWADAETDVPLKVNLVSPDGQTLEQMMFTEVHFPEQIADAEFGMPAGGDAPGAAGDPDDAAEEPEAPAASGQWRFSQLPPGFRVMMKDVRPAANGHGAIEHLLLSDGLSAISVFRTQRVENGRSFVGASRFGAVHAYGRTQGRMQITVVGEVPSQTVQMVGESVEPDAAIQTSDPDRH